MNPKLITILAVTSLIIFLIFFLATPKLSDVANARAVISEQREIIRSITDRVSAVKSEVEEFAALTEAERERVLRAVPEDVDSPNLLFNLESLASSSGLIVEGINIQERAVAGQQGVSAAAPPAGGVVPRFLDAASGSENILDISQAAVSMSVRGRYGSFKDFLKELENNLRLFDVESIAFSSPKAEEGESGNIQFNLVFRAYFIK